MGVDIHVKIAYKDSEKGWKEVKLYTKNDEDKFEEVDIFPGKNSEIFDIMSGKEDEYFPNTPIYKKDLPDSIVKEIEEAENTFGYFNFYEVNLADLKLYIKNHPTIPDYDAEWKDDKKVYKPNPIISVVEDVEAFMDFAEPFWVFDGSYSCIRIIYWFDR